MNIDTTQSIAMGMKETFQSRPTSTKSLEDIPRRVPKQLDAEFRDMMKSLLSSVDRSVSNAVLET